MIDLQNPGIGLIGLGIGQTHLLGYERKGLRVEAICDKDEERLHYAGDRFDIHKRYTRIADLIADNDVDILDLAVHPWIRSPIVNAACTNRKAYILSKAIFNDNASGCKKWWKYVKRIKYNLW